MELAKVTKISAVVNIGCNVILAILFVEFSKHVGYKFLRNDTQYHAIRDDSQLLNHICPIYCEISFVNNSAMLLGN